MPPPPTLDVITLGRCSVDLYGQQIGTRLEDMASFAKAVGGSPTNIAVGRARLGLRAGLITRVGDEPFGRFIREQLDREGVDTATVVTDLRRLTALAFVGVRDEHGFPLVFYRENCADMALCVDDIDADAVGRAGALVLTGSHLSTEIVRSASHAAVAAARAAGRRIALDIDYRPNLWGLAHRGAGDVRYVASAVVTAELRRIVPLCDLIVGTDAAWSAIGAAIETGDPLCRGIVVLGLEAPLPELAESFAIAARNPWVKGFAVGRSIFAEAAEHWLAGAISDAQAVTAMADKFRTLVAAWQTARSARQAA